jgi:hypothetical protein
VRKSGHSNSDKLTFTGRPADPSRGFPEPTELEQGIVTESTKAVFLSYASQDADAAARICEALRAAGVEVWLDQSSLRGG